MGDVVGADRVDGDVVVAELARQRPREADDRRLRGDIVEEVRDAARHGHRRRVDDPPVPGLPHERHHGPRREPGAAHVDGECVIPLVDLDLVERLLVDLREVARIVDEHVDAAERSHGLLRHGLGRSLVGDVDMDGEGRTVRPLDLADHVRAVADVGHDDPVALARQAERVGAPEPARSAGDDRDA